jgi:hypothetical protein
VYTRIHDYHTHTHSSFPATVRNNFTFIPDLSFWQFEFIHFHWGSLPVYFVTHMSLRSAVCLIIHSLVYFYICLSIHIAYTHVCLFICLSIYSIYYLFSVCVSVYLSVYLCIYLSASRQAFVSSVYPSIHPSIYIFIYPFISVSVHQFTHLFVVLSTVHLNINCIKYFMRAQTHAVLSQE